MSDVNACILNFRIKTCGFQILASLKSAFYIARFFLLHIILHELLDLIKRDDIRPVIKILRGLHPVLSSVPCCLHRRCPLSYQHKRPC